MRNFTSTGRRSRATRLVIGAAAVSLVAAACGTEDTDSDEQEAAGQEQPPATETEDDPGAAGALLTHVSEHSFDETVEGLQEATSEAGMMVLGDINQAGALEATGLDLDGAHSFFIGNPEAGQNFFEATPGIGAVIPVRVHVWADDGGTTHVSYFDPAPLFTAVDDDLAEGGQMMSDIASDIAGAVE
ncbi:DUF302 domain-containing protein [Haloechinothrix sp. LS1_15]|uniref:DUF302 domain-containing protein n=1 Tax=Haloechinothrix sp. LS1_15 TaxID=2652248 RepID=UPI00294AA1FD|nr:DUF302 domain-containing protein [Haloechinothrix sp. LS1_15]